jgi:hypothetical protein
MNDLVAPPARAGSSARAMSPDSASYGAGQGECARAAVARLRERIVRDRSAFHVFEHRGRRLVYAPWRGALLELDAASFVVLRGIEAGSNDAEIEAALRDADPEADIAKIAGELERRERLGLTYRQLSDETGIPANTLAHWARRLRREARGDARPRRGRAAFVELVAGPRASGIELVLRGDRRLRIEADFDEDLLARVVAAVERC